MTLTNSQKERLKEADDIIARATEIIQAAQNTSKQPRFGPIDQSTFFSLTAKWTKEMIEHAPAYSSDSRVRDAWLSKFWPNEPYLSGVINSVVQIDRNRGWSLVGGRNQVIRFSTILHNWQVVPGQMGWRNGVGAGALSFYTTDMGFLGEVGRQFENGPVAGLFHLDPTRCILTGIPETPIKYFPKLKGGGIRTTTRGAIDFAPQDVIRVNSMTNIDEGMNGLGYCALSRCMELAITMCAVWQHEQEMLFARAPKGLLLLKGIEETAWKDAMDSNDAELDNREQQWFNNVAVFCSGHDLDIDAKIFMLSQLPEKFDRKLFTDLLMFGYALAFGYDAREFWPVSMGSLGTGNEVTTQHRKATDKGGREYWYGLQEQIQAQLPPTLHFDADERDAEGELIDANLKKAQADAISAIKADYPKLSDAQIGELMADANLIPRDWVPEEGGEGGEGEATDTDTEDAEQQHRTERLRKRCLEFVEVQQAIDKFPDEPIVQYTWPDNRVQVIFKSGSDALRKYVTVDDNWAHSKQTRFAIMGPVRQKVGNYPGIRERYHNTLIEDITGCLLEAVTPTKARNDLKREAATDYVDAFETGWIETGGSPYEPDDTDSEYVASRTTQELDFIDNLFVTIKAMLADQEEPLTMDEINAFAESKAGVYTASLDGIYGQGKMRGKKSVMLTFGGTDGAKSCASCQKYKGQRHRAKWWLARDLVPQPGNDNFICGCYVCQHHLHDDDGNIWAGVQQ